MDAYLYGCRLAVLGVDARDQIHVSWRVWTSGAGCFLKVEGPALVQGRAESPLKSAVCPVSATGF